MAQTNPILAQARKQEAVSADVVEAPTQAPSNEDTFTTRLLAAQESIQAASEVSKANIAKLEETSVAQSSSLGVIQGALKSAADASATIALTKDTAQMEAENKTINAHKAAGGTKIQEQLMAELGRDVTRIEALEDSIDDIHAGESDNLIGKIIAGFRSIPEKAELQRAKEQRISTANNIAAITGATQQIAQTNLVTRRTTNEATINANQQIIKANSDIKATQAELDTLNSNATALSRIHAANQQQIQNQLSLLSLGDRVEQRKIQQEKLVHQRAAMKHEVDQWERQSESLDVRLEQGRLNLEQSKKSGPVAQAKAELSLQELQKQILERDNTNASMVANVRKAQAAFGTVAKGSQEEAGIILAGIRRRDPKYLALLEKGSLPEISFGITPAEARANFSLVSPTGAILPTRITALLEAIDGELGKLPQQPKKAEFAATYNKIAEAYMAVQASEIKADDASNPMQAPPMATLLQNSDLQLQPLYTKVLKPMNMTEVIPQTIVEAATSGVASKQVTVEEAVAGIKAIFSTAALINSEQDKGFKAIGLNSQVTYNTMIARPAGFVENLSTQFKSIFSPSTVAHNLALAAKGVSELVEGPVSKETLEQLQGSFKATRGEIVDLINPVTVRHILVQQLNGRVSTVENNVEGNE